MKTAIVDGVEVITEGDRGPVVLMLHGWPDTRVLWHAQVARLRQVEMNPVNYCLSASGFLAEIDRMQLEVRDYLTLHPSELKAAG